MKKLMLCVLCLMLCASCALAEPMTMGSDLTGVVCYPESAAEADAAYVYRYSYPQAAGNDDVSVMINDFYAYLVDDALAFTIPMAADQLDEGGVQAYTNVVSRVTCNNDSYLSVLVTTENFMGASTSEVYAGHTFALTGGKAGNALSLPHLLGMLKDDETDTWMQERQTTKANELVWKLIWAIIEQQTADNSVAYYDDLTYETLTMLFYPEEDFYLDENGDPVFFIQSAMIASEAEGVLTFPFTLEELKDEL